MAANPLWAFSLAVYARPGVAAACLDLQDRHGADVNLVLFALWAGAECGATVTEAELERLRGVAAPWQAEVVGPLRAVRRRLKGEADAAALREEVKALELAAERVEQDRLFARSGLRPGRGSAVAAEANLRRLLPPEAAGAVAALLRAAG
ncbi:TIGR02444 family protein [Azospirillum sp. A39]|uniref:TIGR02444 family protein n=1 Tax=Azospirillum sp. A39 TaxID=3462279 RepID=UPI00404609AA